MVDRVRGHFGPDGRWVFEVHGEPALDFANTLGDRPTTPWERLVDYEDLLRWSLRAEVLRPTEADELRAVAKARPRLAQAAVERARTAREALHAVAYALARGQAAPAGPLAELNALLPEAYAHVKLEPRGPALGLRWECGDAVLERPLRTVLRDAASLLSSPERLARVRICDSETCQWLFLDTSKNRSRRWCDMAVCGNRAKVKRHYEKHKD